VSAASAASASAATPTPPWPPLPSPLLLYDRSLAALATIDWGDAMPIRSGQSERAERREQYGDRAAGDWRGAGKLTQRRPQQLWKAGLAEADIARQRLPKRGVMEDRSGCQARGAARRRGSLDGHAELRPTQSRVGGARSADQPAVCSEELDIHRSPGLEGGGVGDTSEADAAELQAQAGIHGRRPDRAPRHQSHPQGDPGVGRTLVAGSGRWDRGHQGRQRGFQLIPQVAGQGAAQRHRVHPRRQH